MSPSPKLLIISIFILFIFFQFSKQCNKFGKPCKNNDDCCHGLYCTDVFNAGGDVVGLGCGQVGAG